MMLGTTVTAGRSARRFIGAFLIGTMVFQAAVICAGENSELAPLAAKSLLLAVARTETSIVAVGDRGHVLLSKDDGRTWAQRLVPTRAMLTGVSFPDALHGWAVGHDGVPKFKS